MKSPNIEKEKYNKRVRKAEGYKLAPWLILFFSVALFVIVLFFSISAGSIGFSPVQTLKVLANLLFGVGDISNIPDNSVTIILDIRLPRALLAAMVGAALSLSGAAMQGLLKNSLADGSTLGVASGGTLGAILAIAFNINLSFIPGSGVVIMSILFSFLSLVLILYLSYKIDYNLSTQTIILMGIIFTMLINSINSLIVSLSGESLKQVVFWTMGSFSGRGWSHVFLMLPLFIIATVILLALSRELDAFSLGEEQAGYIGVNTKIVKFLILILVSVLVGVSVAVSGTIGFVGLVIPHITRFITGPNHKKLMVYSVLFGASFLMATDLLSRTIMSPAELPIGVVTSLIGALIFIYIFFKKSKHRI